MARPAEVISVPVILRTEIFLHQPGQENAVIEKAVKRFSELFPIEWKDHYLKEITSQLGGMVPIVSSKVQRQRHNVVTITDPGGNKVGYVVQATAKVLIAVDAKDRKLMRIKETPAISGNVINLPVANSVAAQAAYTQAIQSFYDACLVWREEIKKRYEQSPTDRLVYTQNCAELPYPSVEVHRWTTRVNHGKFLPTIVSQQNEAWTVQYRLESPYVHVLSATDRGSSQATTELGARPAVSVSAAGLFEGQPLSPAEMWEKIHALYEKSPPATVADLGINKVWRGRSFAGDDFYLKTLTNGEDPRLGGQAFSLVQKVWPQTFQQVDFQLAAFGRQLMTQNLLVPLATEERDLIAAMKAHATLTIPRTYYWEPGGMLPADKRREYRFRRVTWPDRTQHTLVALSICPEPEGCNSVPMGQPTNGIHFFESHDSQ
ncbi:MAG: hypothetical protein HYZ71_06570 [Deltaproteobacteria bacterium]|nr:hypothetical protein [Deltaproteobacteria bacterium]